MVKKLQINNFGFEVFKSHISCVSSNLSMLHVEKLQIVDFDFEVFEAFKSHISSVSSNLSMLHGVKVANHQFWF